MSDQHTRRGFLAGGLAVGGSVAASLFTTTQRGTSDEASDQSGEGTLMNVSATVGDEEVCRLPSVLASSVGVTDGQQVRLRYGDSPAVFTVDVVADREPAVNEAGRDRLGATGTSFDVEVDTAVVHPSKDESTVAETGGFVERLVDPGGDGVVALAPHGGYIEHPTHEQARRVGDRLGVPAWYCAGWWPGGGAFDRWHVSSTRLHPASFPHLDVVADRGFDVAVSFHGWTESHVAIGGAAPLARREAIRDRVAEAVGDAFDVRLAAPDEHRDGEDPDNVVNWVTASGRDGVQIEQPWDARQQYGPAIADAVSAVFE